MKQAELNDYMSPELYILHEELHSHHLRNLQGEGSGRMRWQTEAIFGISSWHKVKVMQTSIKYPHPGIFSPSLQRVPKMGKKIVKIRKRENTNNIAATILSPQTRLTLRESQILPGGSHKSLQSQGKPLMQNEPCLKLFWPQHSGHELLLHFNL